MSRERLGEEIYDPNEESSSFQSSVRNKTTITAIGKVREHFVSTKCWQSCGSHFRNFKFSFRELCECFSYSTKPSFAKISRDSKSMLSKITLFSWVYLRSLYYWPWKAPEVLSIKDKFYIAFWITFLGQNPYWFGAQWMDFSYHFGHQCVGGICSYHWKAGKIENIRSRLHICNHCLHQYW